MAKQPQTIFSTGLIMRDLLILKDIFEQTEKSDNLIELDDEDVNEIWEEEYLVDNLPDNENLSDINTTIEIHWKESEYAQITITWGNLFQL